MPTLDQIQQTVRQVNPNQEKRLLRMREVPELEFMLAADEKILKIIHALVKCNNDIYSGIFIATNDRCIFFCKGDPNSENILKNIAYKNINNLEYKWEIFSASLIIDSKEDNLTLRALSKGDARGIFDFLNQQCPHKDSSKETKTISISSSADAIISQLERLSSLKCQGILSEEEFIFSKKKLLGI